MEKKKLEHIIKLGLIEIKDASLAGQFALEEWFVEFIKEHFNS